MTQALRSAADRIEVDADALALRIAGYMRSEVQGLPDDPQTFEDLRRGARSHVLGFVRALRRGEPPETIPPAAEALASARALARSKRSLEPVLRLLHFGHHGFLEAWSQELAQAGLSEEELAEAMKLAQAYTFRWLDGLLREVSDEYDRESAVAQRSLDAARGWTVRSVLAGEATDPDAVSRAIAYELRRHHVAFVIWADAWASETSPLPLLTGIANEIARRLGATRALSVPVGRGLVWAWIGLERAPSAEALAGAALVPEVDDGIAVAVGDPGFGLGGFRSSHGDAAEAARVAMLAPKRFGPVVRYRDVELAALLTTDLERARTFVRMQLGALAQEGEEYERLRHTLRVYLEEGGSRVAAAERLRVHPNTVGNRIAACTRLLDGDRLQGDAVLSIALWLADVLGAEALAPPR